MKATLSALALLCAGTLAVAQQSGQTDTKKPANVASIDGQWTVISAEKNGQPMADAKDMTVTVKDNTITCSGKDGKAAMTFKVDFAKIGHARVTEQASAVSTDKPAGGSDKEMTREAVYVLTNDYLAVCIHDDKAAGGADKPAAGGGNDPARPAGASTGNQPSSQSYCTIILKRAGGTERR